MSIHNFLMHCSCLICTSFHPICQFFKWVKSIDFMCVDLILLLRSWNTSQNRSVDNVFVWNSCSPNIHCVDILFHICCHFLGNITENEVNILKFISAFKTILSGKCSKINCCDHLIVIKSAWSFAVSSQSNFLMIANCIICRIIINVDVIWLNIKIDISCRCHWNFWNLKHEFKLTGSFDSFV